MNLITDDIDLLAFAGRQESQYIEKPETWTDDVITRLNGNHVINGDLLPWSKTHSTVALRPGELSVWGGINGHGKSQMLGMVAAWGLKKSKWLIASMEMLPAATLARQCRQVAGTNNPTDEYVKTYLESISDKLWIYDQSDTVESDRIIGMVYYAATELKINHIIIDSLIKCGIGRENYEQQAAFVDRLCWAAKTTGCHVHLVHHMRKGKDESTIPGKFDFRGCAEIADLADNLFVVHRNKAKEEKVRTKQEISDSDPDATLSVVKQRHGEWEGTYLLWFHQESMQYIPQPNGRPIPYIVER